LEFRLNLLYEVLFGTWTRVQIESMYDVNDNKLALEQDLLNLTISHCRELIMTIS
jgi:hypothetical protein